MDAMEYWQTVGQWEMYVKPRTWYGYTEEQYYDLIYQPGDPHWKELKQTED